MNKKLVSFVTMASIIFTSVSPVFAKNFDSKQNVALDHAWTVNFNQKVNVNEAFEGVYIQDSKGNKIPTRVDFSDDHTKMIIKPTDGYAPNSTYTLNIEGVSDEDGKPLSDKATMEFTTANTAQVGSFDITAFTANNGQGTATTNLDPNSSFSFQLSKNVDPSTVNNVTVTDKDGNKANVKVEAVGSNISVIANNNFQDDTKTITVPRNAFKCNTTYTINLKGLKSTDGQEIATTSYSFKTRDYQLNPTINGICNDDYISFGSQYASQLYQIPDGKGDGYYAQSLQKCHDNDGTLMLDPDYNSPDQITDGWNPYANLQNRNLVDLQVELRHEYQKILAKNPSYTGYSVGFREGAPTNSDGINEDGMVEYQYMNNVLNTQPAWSFQLTSYYNTSIFSGFGTAGLENSSNFQPLVDEMTSQEPQVALYMSGMRSGSDGNLTKLALYQSLYCTFGGDYAPEIYNYMLSKVGVYAPDTLDTTQIGNIKIYSNYGAYIFKY
ncbi:Ig-like domain-containing protein [Clostridium hydrogenum]|uniref:Ig-like domain-containing protein n=1 Tax=Clostridium hydrogenum TaxID=2855764 RepID=UPI001F42F7B6|nr:Ig-like domain-containing protein [Clostridium hydrogenum]